MVQIKKGKKKMEVSSAAYETIYKSNGWKLVSGKSSTKSPAIEAGDDEWEEALMEDEKPLSKMSHDELVARAISLGVDVSGNPSSKQLRERIERVG